MVNRYDCNYYLEQIIYAGNVYVERNYEMIDNNSYCVIYYDENHMPHKRKNGIRDMFYCQYNNGTKVAYDYSKKKRSESYKRAITHLKSILRDDVQGC